MKKTPIKIIEDDDKPNLIPYSEVRKRWMEDPEFKKAYDALEPEYAIIRAILKKRIESKMSQKDLAKKLGTKQSAISRLESGTYNPTLSFLKKLSTALGGKLEIKI
jgi:ribosome-binding protein aMBF1 (putative translation factor)